MISSQNEHIRDVACRLGWRYLQYEVVRRGNCNLQAAKASAASRATCMPACACQTMQEGSMHHMRLVKIPQLFGLHMVAVAHAGHFFNMQLWTACRCQMRAKQQPTFIQQSPSWSSSSSAGGSPSWVLTLAGDQHTAAMASCSQRSSGEDQLS